MDDQIEKVIEVKNVKKVYRMGSEKIYAVDDVSFEILKGEFCCLLGTSGSGKSTLLNLMAGIEKLSGGQIFIKGKKIHKMSENSLARFRQRYLGFVFQSYNLMGSMTALENVEFPLVFKRVKAKARRKMARDMLIKVGLGSRLTHKPKEMSGGQQQRVGIARAFVAKPEIVFADEPTGNLDTKTAMEVMNLIKSIAKDNNQTIVMVTHDRRLADFADRIIHILDGKIQNVELKDHSFVKTQEAEEDDQTGGNNQIEKMEDNNIDQESDSKTGENVKTEESINTGESINTEESVNAGASIKMEESNTEKSNTEKSNTEKSNMEKSNTEKSMENEIRAEGTPVLKPEAKTVG